MHIGLGLIFLFHKFHEHHHDDGDANAHPHGAAGTDSDKDEDVSQQGKANATDDDATDDGTEAKVNKFIEKHEKGLLMGEKVFLILSALVGSVRLILGSSHSEVEAQH